MIANDGVNLPSSYAISLILVMLQLVLLQANRLMIHY